jgi:hypothetical protein
VVSSAGLYALKQQGEWCQKMISWDEKENAKSNVSFLSQNAERAKSRLPNSEVETGNTTSAIGSHLALN